MRIIGMILAMSSLYVGPVEGAGIDVSLVAQPNGPSGVIVTNHTAQKVMSYAVIWIVNDIDGRGKPTRSASRAVIDGIASDQAVLGPGQSKTVAVVGRAGASVSAEVRAAIFEDGTTFGNLDWVALIRQRRSALLEVLTAANTRLQAAVSAGTSATSLLESLKADFASLESKAQAAMEVDLEDAPPNSLAMAFTETTEQMRPANLQIFVDEERKKVTQAVYRPLITKLGQGSLAPENARQIIAAMAATVNEQKSRLTAAPR